MENKLESIAIEEISGNPVVKTFIRIVRNTCLDYLLSLRKGKSETKN
jgi:hypothetical protein